MPASRITSSDRPSSTLRARRYRAHTHTMALNTNGKRPASASWDHEEHARKILSGSKSILKRTSDGNPEASRTSTSPANDKQFHQNNSPNGILGTSTATACRKGQVNALRNDGVKPLDTEDLSPNASPGWANLFNWPKEEKSEEQRLAEDAEWLARDKLWGPLRVSLLKHCPDWGK